MKKTFIILSALFFSLNLSVNAKAGNWELDGKGWSYKNDEGNYLASTWYWIDGNSDGVAECYYFYPDGYLAVNTSIEGYPVDSDGAWTVNNLKQSKVLSKKGLALTHPDGTVANELGAKKVIVNNLVGHNYRYQFADLKNQGFETTVIMLNPWQTSNPALLPVSAPAAGAVFYGYDVSSEAGLNALRNLADNYASSYKDSVSNWVIGNEINHPNSWNYVPNREPGAYAEQYAKAFRIWYERIKAHNPNANVYIPFDYRWNWYSDQGYGVLQAKPLLTQLNSLLKDTEYGVAWHAYPQDLVDPNFTNDPDAKEGFNSPIINMKNINVLTDFMQQADFKTQSGEVRSIILSEQGFNASSEEVQADMIAKAYTIARENPHIDAFYLSRERDLQEVHFGQVMRFGLMDASGRRRQAFEVYKNLK